MARSDGKRRPKKKRKQVGDEDFEQPFDPGTALEVLHGAMVRIQALSEAAFNSLEFMPRANTPSHRRRISHMCSLVMVLHEEIAKAVAMGDEMVGRLGEYLKKRKT
jgi:hypothetical protein